MIGYPKSRALKRLGIAALTLALGFLYFRSITYRPEIIRQFYHEFEAEAAKRGISIPKRKTFWSFEFESIQGLKAGKCQPGLFWNKISIDPGEWNRLDSVQQKALLFHEFGHCILNRKHKNEKLLCGECSSLMDGGEDGFYCANNFYSEPWWNYYIDELFDSTINAPKWYHTINLSELVLNYKAVMEYDCLENKEKNRFCSINDSVVLNKQANGLIEFELDSAYIWQSNEDIRLNVDSFVFRIDPKNKTLSIHKLSNRFNLLDEHYFVLEHANNSFPSLTKLDVLFRTGWIYFLVNEKQIHHLAFAGQTEGIRIAIANNRSNGRINVFDF